jgi:hypothetical protein
MSQHLGAFVRSVIVSSPRIPAYRFLGTHTVRLLSIGPLARGSTGTTVRTGRTTASHRLGTTCRPLLLVKPAMAAAMTILLRAAPCRLLGTTVTTQTRLGARRMTRGFGARHRRCRLRVMTRDRDTTPRLHSTAGLTTFLVATPPRRRRRRRGTMTVTTAAHLLVTGTRIRLAAAAVAVGLALL